MRSVFCLIAVGGVALSCPASAHHSFAMFDATKFVTWEGTVEQFDWTNPHTHIALIVPAGGKDPTMAGRWDIEGSSPNIMARQGWTKTTFKPGDKITVVGHPLRSGRGGSMSYAIDKNGKKLYMDVNRPSPEPASVAAPN